MNPSRSARVLIGESVCLLGVAVFLAGPPRLEADGAQPESAPRRLAVSVPFIANAGQADQAVAYYAPTFAGTIFVTRDGRIVHALRAGSARQKEKPGWSLTETPVGADGTVRPVGQERARTQVSDFHGTDPSAWRSGVATYEGVSLGRVWPGVTLFLRAHGKNVEKVFTVEPGANPSRIRMCVSGARSLEPDGKGGLVASTGLGGVRLSHPIAYQEFGGARRAIPVAYDVRGDIYTFRVGDYDTELPLVIDPFLQATYMGGSGDDIANVVAIHPTSGDVYVAGVASSTNFPGTSGGAQPAAAGGGDAFVVRLTADLKTLTQATYLGGSGSEVPYALAIDPTSGDVYVTGVTSSANFPGTSGGAQASFAGGGGDAFVARLTADLKTLTQATYLGTSAHEIPYALAIHPTSGDVYVTGITDSPNFPVTAGALQSIFGGGFFDAFVARLAANLKTLKAATYLGTAGDDRAFALAIHPASGDVYVAGYTSSTNFNGGQSDAFVARLSADLATLMRATLVGGNGDDRATGLAIHPASGDVYVAGWTTSTNFPDTSGGAQPAFGGGDADGFVARLTADLNTLTQSTYLGGSGHDAASACAIHATSGDVYVTGLTDSAKFPGTSGGLQPAFGGGTSDGFVARLTADLHKLTQSTYLGGSGGDGANALAVHPFSGDVYVAGYTLSTNFPGVTGGAQPANHGGRDGFVARLTLGPGPAPTAFYTLTPCRAVDTRNPNGPYGGPAIATGPGRSFVLTGRCGIPATAKAVSINVTATLPTAAGGLRVYPGGIALPFVSTISYETGQTRANNVAVGLGPAGDLLVHCDQTSGTVHVIVDVNGYLQ